MKKFHIFPVFFIFSVLFACRFPTAIEVRGTPELRFSAKMDIGDMFAQQLKDGFDGTNFTLTPCVNTTNLTFIVHSYLFDETINIDERTPEGYKFLPDDYGRELTEQRNVIEPENSTTIPLSGLDDLLKGFSFSSPKIFLFASGSPVVEKLCLEITADGKKQLIHIADKGNTQSDYKKWGNGYFAKTPPVGGHPIDLSLDGDQISINYRVYGDIGKTFERCEFVKAEIRVEFVIWLPMEFITGPGGAEISFPADFFGETDLFGRDPDDESAAMDIIESLSMIIKLNTNPFLGKKLVISSKGIGITEQVKTNSLNFVFDEKTMAKINNPDNYPFNPTFKFVFDDEDTLKFPRVFNATEIIFSARIKFLIDLRDSPGETDE